MFGHSGLYGFGECFIAGEKYFFFYNFISRRSLRDDILAQKRRDRRDKHLIVNSL